MGRSGYRKLAGKLSVFLGVEMCRSGIPLENIYTSGALIFKLSESSGDLKTIVDAANRMLETGNQLKIVDGRKVKG